MSPGGSGGNQQLANLVVQFTLQGQQQLQQGLDALQQQTGQVQAAVGQLGQQLQTHMQQAGSQTQKAAAAVAQLGAATVKGTEEIKGALDRLTRAVALFHFDYLNKATERDKKTQEAKKPVEELGGVFERLSTRVNVALGIGQAAILGFVRQGLSLSTTGLTLQQRMERLALAISGLFRPEVLKVTEMIERLTDWLGRLSDRQRENIARWAQAGAAALAMGVALPRVLAGVQALVGGFRVLGAAISGSLSATGIGALLPLLGLAVQGVTLLLVGTEEGRAALARFGKAADELGKALGQVAEKLDLHSTLGDLANSLAALTDATAEWVRYLTAAVQKLDELQHHPLAGALLGGNKFQDLLSASITGGLGPLLQKLGYGNEHVEPKNRTTDVYRSAGFASVESIYTRLAQLTVGQRSAADRTADATERTATAAERTATATENHRNPVAVGA